MQWLGRIVGGKIIKWMRLDLSALLTFLFISFLWVSLKLPSIFLRFSSCYSQPRASELIQGQVTNLVIPTRLSWEII